MPRIRLALVAGVVGALAVLGTLVPASAAFAHDQLVSSSPAEGERLSTPPTEVSLEFLDGILDIGAIVVVADAAGRDWAAAEPRISGREVHVPLDGTLPPAGYEVRWRVVSADGHPISGLIPFTVGDGEVDNSVVSGGGAPASSPDSAATVEGEGLPDVVRIGLLAVGGAAAALLAYAGIGLLLRRRRAATPFDSEQEPS